MRDRLDWTAIKDRIDLAAVATALLGTPAKREGRRLLWLCPFHEDHHPSFQVDPDLREWRCWPCGIRDDAAELVKRKNGVTFPEAARIATGLSGIVTPSGTTTRPAPRPRPPASAAAGKPAKPARTPSERSSGLPTEGSIVPRDRGR
jgi:DNA primase